jgi:hypothetical protein
MIKGTKGQLTLGAKQLELLAKKSNSKEAKAILKTVKNPTLEVAYKSKSNYTIAGLNFKDGKNTVAKGAVSITKPGTNKSVVKYRLNTGKSTVNGFIDGGKVANTKDMELALMRKDKMIKVDARVADATAHHLNINEEEVLKYVKDFKGNDFVEKYTQLNKKMQQIADNIMTETKRVLRGESSISSIPANVGFSRLQSQIKRLTRGNSAIEMDFKNIEIPVNNIKNSVKNIKFEI